MRVAISQLKVEPMRRAAAEACVSAGNTGALMALARYVLKTLDGIDRPAIAYRHAQRKAARYTTVLDLGANVDCTAEHLLQFAVMGSALVSALDGTRDADVGLLNIGEEAIKGNDTIKHAGELLRAAAARGRSQLLRQRRRQRHLQGHDRHRRLRRLRRQRGAEDQRGPGDDAVATSCAQEFTRNAADQARGAGRACRCCKRFKTRVDPAATTAPRCSGLRGLVFKSHGSADAFAFEQALNAGL